MESDARTGQLSHVAFLTGEGRANLLDLCAELLFSPNKVTDVFAIVCVVTTFDLRLDPVILLIRQRSLAHSVGSFRANQLSYPGHRNNVTY